MALATADSATPSPGVIAATAEEDKVIDTDAYHVVFFHRGAVVKSWTLKNYKDSAGKPLELVKPDRRCKSRAPIQLRLPR